MQGSRIGIDLGGTKIEAIALDVNGAVLERVRTATPGPDHATRYLAIVEAIAVQVEAMCRKLGTSPEGASVGVGIPGMVDHFGRVQNANTTCLIDQPLATDLEARLGCPVHIENDANCFTLAECRSGAGRDYSLVFGVIMGTGCGGGLCLAGDVRSGPHGIAGEWGHLSIDPQGPECYCGKRGCIETLISGGGVERSFLEATGRALSVPEIQLAARQGDPECKAAMSSFLQSFGRALGGLISILDPDAIVLGGGLSAIEELYTTGTDLVRRAAFHPDCQTPILKNELGDSAGVFGAAWLGA